MTEEQEQPIDARTQAALSELQGIIKQHYPDATFQVTRSQDDPQAIHLLTTVDVEDRGEVLDAVMDRMMELQIAEDLPIFVIPRRPRERMLAIRRALAQASGQKRFPPPLAP
jgi:hypothetical protein